MNLKVFLENIKFSFGENSNFHSFFFVTFGLMKNELLFSFLLSPLTIMLHGTIVHKENPQFMLHKVPMIFSH